MPSSLAVQTRVLDNGLTLVVESIPHMASVAYEVHLSGGLVADPDERVGESIILAELLSRGTQSLGARELSDAFDILGASHFESAGDDAYKIGGRVLKESFPECFGLSCSIIQEASLPHDEIANIQSVVLQELQSLKDNPSRRVSIEAMALYLPSPWNRSSYGDEEGIKKVSRSSLETLWGSSHGPKGTFVSLAGNILPEVVEEYIVPLLSTWEGTSRERPGFKESSPPRYHHFKEASAQQQVVLLTPFPSLLDPDYYCGRLVNGLLSAGMGGRLFMEVREKRGLCYHVSSQHIALPEYGVLLVYAGTTPQRVDETVKVSRDQLQGLFQSVTEEELARVKMSMTSSLVIREESPSARASRNCNDQRYFGRVRELAEIENAINAISIEQIDKFVSTWMHAPPSLFTLGPRDLE